MVERLKLSVLDLQDPMRMRNAVAKVLVGALKENNFEVGPKLEHVQDITHSDLLKFLEGVGVANAEQEAISIMADVYRAIWNALPE